jgi:hypothetical protein
MLVDEPRWNLLTQTEFPNGVTDAPSRGGLISATSMTGFAGALAFGYDGVVTAHAYKTFAFTAGLTYTLSVIFEMTDGLGPPVVHATSSLSDMVLVVAGVTVAAASHTITALSDGRYRVSATRQAAASGVTTIGIVKYAYYTGRTFKTSGWQAVVGALPGPYQAITTAGAYVGLPSSVPENDYAEWSSATAYIIGDRVISTASHSVYECVLGHTNQSPLVDVSPTTGVGTYWLRVSATNRWKAFDKRLAEQVSHAWSIVYDLLLSEPITSVAFFGLQAEAVRITIIDPAFGIVFDLLRPTIDQTAVIDWWTYFYEDGAFSSQVSIPGIPGFSGSIMRIEISGSGTNKVGQIVLGKDKKLGTALANTGTGIVDYSRKDRDTFGNPVIVERAYADRVDFRFSLPSSDANRVKSLLASMRATPAIYHAGDGTDQYGTTVYGYFKDFTITLASVPVSFASMEIEGLV